MVYKTDFIEQSQSPPANQHLTWQEAGRRQRAQEELAKAEAGRKAATKPARKRSKRRST